MRFAFFCLSVNVGRLTSREAESRLQKLNILLQMPKLKAEETIEHEGQGSVYLALALASPKPREVSWACASSFRLSYALKWVNISDFESEN